MSLLSQNPNVNDAPVSATIHSPEASRTIKRLSQILPLLVLVFQNLLVSAVVVLIAIRIFNIF
jgi:hypothetical protein